MCPLEMFHFSVDGKKRRFENNDQKMSKVLV